MQKQLLCHQSCATCRRKRKKPSPWRKGEDSPLCLRLTFDIAVWLRRWPSCSTSLAPEGSSCPCPGLICSHGGLLGAHLLVRFHPRAGSHSPISWIPCMFCRHSWLSDSVRKCVWIVHFLSACLDWILTGYKVIFPTRLKQSAPWSSIRGCWYVSTAGVIIIHQEAVCPLL